MSDTPHRKRPKVVGRKPPQVEPTETVGPPPRVRKNARVRIRRWTEADLPGLVACHAAAYSDYPARSLDDHRLYAFVLRAFPEGQILAEIDGYVVGYATSLIVQLKGDLSENIYSYSELTGGGTFSTHNPSGDTLYGADIAVHPDFRGRGIAGKLYEGRFKLLRRYNLRRMVAYGRLPGYTEHAGKLLPEEYVAKVVGGELSDPALRAHLKAGYTVKNIVLDLFNDRSSLNYSTIIEAANPDYKADRRRLAAPPLERPVRRMRVCAAQYLMRPVADWESMERTVRFFVDTADTYHCHFLVLPELFTVQMLSTMPRRAALDAISELANMTDRYVQMLSDLAVEHGLYIIGGSHPVKRDGVTYNVAHFFTPSGQVHTQDKLHITPSERRDFGIAPGEGLRVFHTPLGRIAIQVCYDIEFPEVSRLLALAGVEVIFVPFSTDDRKAYMRVRYSAQARAVENYIYLALAGNVGNLPHRSYLVNYGQSAILTPSDFAFPDNGTAAEADPNVETVVIADLDLAALAVQRELGSVRPLRDRRVDMFNLTLREPIEIVRV